MDSNETLIVRRALINMANGEHMGDVQRSVRHLCEQLGWSVPDWDDDADDTLVPPADWGDLWTNS